MTPFRALPTELPHPRGWTGLEPATPNASEEMFAASFTNMKPNSLHIALPIELPPCIY